MSGKISGMVWDLALEPPEKYVLLAYADHADHRGHNVRPGVELIAYKTGYSQRNIQKIVSRLRDQGYLIPVKYASGGRGKVTEYRINFSRAHWTEDTLSQKGEPQDTLSQKGEPQDTLSDEKGERKGERKGEPQFARIRPPSVSPSDSPSYLPPEPEPWIPGTGGGERAREATAWAAYETSEPFPSATPVVTSGYTMPTAYQTSPELLTQLTRDCPHVDVSLTVKRCLATTFRRPILDPALTLQKFCLDEEARALDAIAQRAPPTAPAPTFTNPVFANAYKATKGGTP